MKKLLLVVSCVVLFSGCANTQDKIDRYKEKRYKASKEVNKAKCKKDGFKKCNSISNDLDRASCKFNTIEICNQ